MEIITAIEEISIREGGYSKESGFKITTNEQEILLLISDESKCCESWGYFLTEDDTSKFVGTKLLGISITDTNRSNRKFVTDWMNYEENSIRLDSGNIMFVDIETDRGVLQFVAYNAHNGCYGHEAKVQSRQLTYSVSL